jgi:chromate transporter
MVLQFVGFLGGWNQPGCYPPLLRRRSGAAINDWVTFVPCFLWIFLGRPTSSNSAAMNGSRALSAVTAAVVGVILNLAVWFGLHALFPPPEW